ncbi:unnamed protein product, partial [marine sediment metagenome]
SLLLFLWLACFTGNLRAQQDDIAIESISFTGNSQFTTKTLIEYCEITIPGMYDYNNFTQKLRRILSLYQDNGFYYAQIDSVYLKNSKRDGYYDVNIDVKEGDIFKLGSITIIGASQDELAHLHEIVPVEGTLFTRGVVERFIEHVTNYYENIGYPYISVNTVNTVINSSNGSDMKMVNVDLTILKNKFVEIDTISVAGAEYTKPEIIIRESRLRTGEVFKEEKMKKSKEFIQKLPFLSEVSSPELFELENGKSMVQFTVKEKKSNRFNGLLGYVPSGIHGNGYYIGTFLIDAGNMFGTGRVFQGEWQKLDRTSQKLRIVYEEPWVMGFPVTIRGQFEQSLQDSSFVKRAFLLGFRYRLNSTLNA